MALGNCPRCGNLFNKVTIDICPECYNEEQELLRITQRYLREHRTASVANVLTDMCEEGTELEQWMLEKWIKEKRINLAPEEVSEIKPRCPFCSRELKEGEKLCKTCQLKKMMGKKDSSPPPSSSTPDDSSKTSTGNYRKRNQ